MKHWRGRLAVIPRWCNWPVSSPDNAAENFMGHTIFVVTQFRLSPFVPALSFVCEEARQDQEEYVTSKDRPRKVAMIRALLPGRNEDREIRAQGCGRSTRNAASRALLNLLGNRQLCHRSFTDLQLELSVLNVGQLVKG
jgi:hypothetical protein